MPSTYPPDSTLLHLVEKLGEALRHQVEVNPLASDGYESLLDAYCRLYALKLKAVAIGLNCAQAEWETGQLFLKFYRDQRARDVAESDFDNTEKIDLLGQLIFPGIWPGIVGVTDHRYRRSSEAAPAIKPHPHIGESEAENPAETTGTVVSPDSPKPGPESI